MAGIGKFQTVTGVVTVTRSNIVGQAIAGDSIYRGDVIETADDGAATLIFSDGTRLQLYTGTRVALDDFVFDADGSSGAGLIGIAKGVFAVVAGKLARAGRLVIETPLGQIRSRGPAAGIGSLALGILTFKLIKELRAQGADPNGPANANAADHVTINDNDLKQGKLDYAQGDANELEHGVFVVDTYDGKHYVVDDVTKTLWIHGSSATLVASNLVAFNADYLGAKDVYNDFRNDPFFDQYRHAKADPNSNGSTGSSEIVGPNLAGNNNLIQQVAIIIAPHSSGSNEGGSSSTTGFIISAPPLTPPPAPTIVVPPPQTLGVNQFSPIPFGVNQPGTISVSVSESVSLPNEIFTVTLTDSSGLLSATGASGNGTNILTISGSLSQVNAALATLSDTNQVVGVDNIAVNATSSLNNVAASAIIPVTVNGPPVISVPDPVIGVGQPAAISRRQHIGDAATPPAKPLR